jgi:hypothetical protein
MGWSAKMPFRKKEVAPTKAASVEVQTVAGRNIVISAVFAHTNTVLLVKDVLPVLAPCPVMYAPRGRKA